jgi:orotate phosphoribosyltransferase
MEFKSYADLEADVIHLLPKLPRDIDLVVGIPRSGIAPAAMISLHLNVPMTDLNGLFEGRIMANGQRKMRRSVPEDLHERPLNVLIVDDAVGKGVQLRRIREDLAARNLKHNLKFAVIYATSVGEALVDYYSRKLPPLRHFFAWNIIHHYGVHQWCFDMDGVLCRDCLVEEDDDGPRYRAFLTDCEPLFLPTGKVGWIITSRLEKYRPETEDWLLRHGVQYETLLMHPARTLEERRSSGGGGPFKGNYYKTLPAGMFIESNLAEAETIARTAGKHVFCVDARMMVSPDAASRVRALARKGPSAYLRYAKRVIGNFNQTRKNAAFGKR